MPKPSKHCLAMFEMASLMLTFLSLNDLVLTSKKLYINLSSFRSSPKHMWLIVWAKMRSNTCGRLILASFFCSISASHLSHELFRCYLKTLAIIASFCLKNMWLIAFLCAFQVSSVCMNTNMSPKTQSKIFCKVSYLSINLLALPEYISWMTSGSWT